MQDISLNSEFMVCDNKIYFVYREEGEDQAHVECYNIDNNSFERSNITEDILRMKIFGNEFFYWRTAKGGKSDDKYVSSIYFDGL